MVNLIHFLRIQRKELCRPTQIDIMQFTYFCQFFCYWGKKLVVILDDNHLWARLFFCKYNFGSIYLIFVMCLHDISPILIIHDESAQLQLELNSIYSPHFAI